MLYRYDEEKLGFVEINWPQKIIFALGLITFSLLVFISGEQINEKITESRILVILTQRNQFSNEKLISKIKEMHFSFPYIVYAQALHETGDFKSSIFLENHNLYGMKEAAFRITLAKGTKNNHAYYTDWEASLFDYGYYQATYLSKLQTEEDYFNYLEQFYAEDPGYVNKVKSIIQKENLRELFK